MASGLPGQRIQYYRAQQRMSQAELARRAHTTVASISRIENNKQNYTKNLLQQLATVLGVTVTDLFDPLEAPVARRLLSPTQEELLHCAAHLPERVVVHLLLLVRMLLDTAPPVSASGGDPWVAWLARQHRCTLDHPCAE